MVTTIAPCPSAIPWTLKTDIVAVGRIPFGPNASKDTQDINQPITSGPAKVHTHRTFPCLRRLLRAA